MSRAKLQAKRAGSSCTVLRTVIVAHMATYRRDVASDDEEAFVSGEEGELEFSESSDEESVVPARSRSSSRSTQSRTEAARAAPGKRRRIASDITCHCVSCPFSPDTCVAAFELCSHLSRDSSACEPQCFSVVTVSVVQPRGWSGCRTRGSRRRGAC